MQLLREPHTTKNENSGRINESGEAGVVLTEPQRDVLTETALVGFTCRARVVLTWTEWVRFAKNSILKMPRTILFVKGQIFNDISFLTLLPLKKLRYIFYFGRLRTD